MLTSAYASMYTGFTSDADVADAVAFYSDSELIPDGEPRIQHGKHVPAATVERFSAWYTDAVSRTVLPST